MSVTKRSEIHVGDVWTAQVSGRPAKVRIDSDCGDYSNWKGNTRHDGWNATNLTTGKKIHIRTAARLRNLVFGLDGGNRKLTNKMLGKIVLSSGQEI